MAGRMVFDLIDPAESTAYIRAYNNEVLFNQFSLQRLFPYHETVDLEWKVRTGTWRDVDMAEYRAFDTPTGFTGRQGYGRLRGEIAPLGKGIPLGEEEMLRLRALQADDDNPLIAEIYNDMERVMRSVQARLEYARGQVLTTGKFTLTAENGLTMEADFGMASNHKVTAALTWANASALILSELLAWQQFYVDETGELPGEMQMSRKILGYMLTNTEMKSAGAFGGTTPGRLNVEMVDAILAANGLPPITLYDTQVRKDGVATRVIPDDKIVFLPAGDVPIGTTEYGITAEAIKLAAKGYIKQSEMPGVVGFITENDHPVQTFTHASALAMPVFNGPDAVVVADVVP